MKNTFVIIGIVFVAFFIGCAEEDNTFLIAENSVGPLEKSSPISAIESIFRHDSIVKDTMSSKVGASSNKIQIFEKGGLPLLVLTPNTDSIPSTENIQILDYRYQAENGIGLLSTFEDIQDQYTIKKVVTTLNSLVVFPKGSNLYFTIDKTELPYNLRFTNSKIEAVQIPDEAKIKYLMLSWD